METDGAACVKSQRGRRFATDEKSNASNDVYDLMCLAGLVTYMT